MRRLDLVLGTSPSEAKRLRNELHAWLLDAGINGSTGYDIRTAANEAFANSVQHPVGRRSHEIRISGEITGQEVQVTIRDDGTWKPSEVNSQHHYGYPLINTLMDAVDVAATRDGTAITLRKAL
jgi:anti-sigma regulatory factor (Ser/Thr protein kinase)